MLLQVGFDDNTYYFIVQFTDNIRMLLQVGFDDNTYYFIVQFTDNICSYKWGLMITHTTSLYSLQTIYAPTSGV